MSQQKFQRCIAACMESALESTQCASACLNEQNIKMVADCIRLDRDCAAICYLAMDAMARESAFVKQICSLCAEICTTCATECEKHSYMEHCKKCAEACRKCAEACRDMSKV